MSKFLRTPLVVKGKTHSPSTYAALVENNQCRYNLLMSGRGSVKTCESLHATLPSIRRGRGVVGTNIGAHMGSHSRRPPLAPRQALIDPE